MGEPEGNGIDAIRAAETLSALSAAVGADTIHEGYFRAKRIWEAEIARQQTDSPDQSGVPGTTVTVDDHSMHIHGITHAGTAAEREFLREYVENVLDRGAVVYCEQGIRPMYFEDMAGVCEMDDYRWAKAECERLDGETQFEIFQESFESIPQAFSEFATELRAATFSMIDAGSSVYSEQFERTLGDIAAGFLSDHTDLAVGNSYEAFRLSRAASTNPDRLHALQQYYERAFLPQPLEREWLRRHDPELELFSHGRNERMAEYVAYHNDSIEEVHLIVGAAHQHGVAYYLERGDGHQPENFDFY